MENEECSSNRDFPALSAHLCLHREERWKPHLCCDPSTPRLTLMWTDPGHSHFLLLLLQWQVHRTQMCFSKSVSELLWRRLLLTGSETQPAASTKARFTWDKRRPFSDTIWNANDKFYITLKKERERESDL